MWLFHIDYLFIELPENMLYRDIYSYRDMKYRDRRFWPYRPALPAVSLVKTQ